MSETRAKAAVCELELKNGSMCAVPAIGRCATCERAFCLTHQARDPKTNGGYVNECAPCLIQRLADARERKQKAEADIAEAREYFTSGLARIAFLSKGIQPVKIYGHEQKLRKSIFGDRCVDVAFSEHGWILGEFLWGWRRLVRSSFGWGSEDVYEHEHRKLLTVLLDIPVSKDTWSELAAVNKVRGSYEIFCYQTNKKRRGSVLRGDTYSEQDGTLKDWPRDLDWQEGRVHGWEWVELAQAVRQLTTVPS